MMFIQHHLFDNDVAMVCNFKGIPEHWDIYANNIIVYVQMN